MNIICACCVYNDRYLYKIYEAGLCWTGAVVMCYLYTSIVYIFYLSEDLVTPPEETDSKL